MRSTMASARSGSCNTFPRPTRALLVVRRMPRRASEPSASSNTTASPKGTTRTRTPRSTAHRPAATKAANSCEPSFARGPRRQFPKSLPPSNSSAPPRSRSPGSPQRQSRDGSGAHGLLLPAQHETRLGRCFLPESQILPVSTHCQRRMRTLNRRNTPPMVAPSQATVVVVASA